MGFSQADKQASHRRIVDIAARRFRELGLEGIGVSDVMKEANLTVGGFYKHFASRDQLVIEAIARAFEDLDAWEAQGRDVSGSIGWYLSEGHRDDPGNGCAMGALLTDVSHSADAVRSVYTDRIAHTLSYLEELLVAVPPPSRRAKAIVMLSALLGAIGLSRAVNDADLSDEILSSAAQQLMEGSGARVI